MRAKKSLGQNFLQDESVIQRIVDALGLTADDTVIEIGPGRGALTEKLIERAGKVIAIEFDRDMVAFLSDRFGDAFGYGKANSGPDARDHRVDADDLTVEIHEWAAGVARIDGSVGLDIDHRVVRP